MKVCYPRLSVKKLVSRLRKAALKLNRRLPLELMILFGSYAQLRQTPSSDIDVLVVYSDPPNPSAYKEAIEVIDIHQLELHIYSQREYRRLKLSRSTIPREAESKGIPVWGRP